MKLEKPWLAVMLAETAGQSRYLRLGDKGKLMEVNNGWGIVSFDRIECDIRVSLWSLRLIQNIDKIKENANTCICHKTK